MSISVPMLCKWLKLFQANKHYEKYCQAREKDDSQSTTALEEAFPSIADLYTDWGDIRGIDTKPFSDANKAWIKTHTHLFSDTQSARWIEHPENYQHRPGYMLIEIPLMDKQSRTKDIIEGFLKLVYKTRQQAATESTKPSVRLIMIQRPAPKYQLKAIDGKVSAAAIRNLNKALYVNQWRSKRKNGKPLSITETVLAIKQDRRNPMGWKMSNEDTDALARGTFFKYILNGSEVTLVKRHRKEFDAYVRNTIHGRFPDNT